MNWLAQNVLKLSHHKLKKNWGHNQTQTDKQTHDTHPGRIIVPDGIYSVGDRKRTETNNQNFHYRWSESVTALQGFLQRPTWEQLVDKRRSGFVNRLLNSQIDSLARRLLT